MIPIWTLKLGSVAVTLASTAGFWHYVSGHVHPVREPLKPKVVQTVDDTPTKADVGWDMSGTPVATPTPAIVKKIVVVQGPQQQVQSSAALGATWVANQTGQKPVQATHVS
jgi:hypothetical protein